MVHRSSRSATLVALAAVIVLTLVGASCGSGSSATSSSSTFASRLDQEGAAGAPKPGGNLEVALVAETNSWNPFEGQWANSGLIVGRAIFDPLAALDGQGGVRPYLAEAIEPDDTFTHWRIILRPGVTFHDGTPLDADALKLNLDTRKKGAVTGVGFAPVADISILDDRTVQVTMSQPWSTFDQALTAQGGYVAAPAMLADPAGGSHPIGTGPFVFSSWQRDAKLQVDRNPNYWRKDAAGNALPYLDSIGFSVIPDPSSRRAAVASGTVDAAEVNTAAEIVDAQQQGEEGDLQVLTDSASQGESVVVLNSAVAPFDDPVARRAMSYAVDRDTIAEVSYQGAYPATSGPLRPGAPGYLDPADSGAPQFDPDQARALADQYEATHGQPIRFTSLGTSDPSGLELGQLLQSQLASVGIEMSIEATEQATLISRVVLGDFQASGFVFFDSPTLDASYVFIASQPKPVGQLSLNIARIANPKITAAMNDGRSTRDPDRRAAADAIVQRELATDAGQIFIVRNSSSLVFLQSVHGFSATTFPDSDVEANGNPVTPFLTTTWNR